MVYHTTSIKFSLISLSGSLRNVYGTTHADMHSLFTQYPEIPNSANNYFKDGYTATFYSTTTDFTDVQKELCQLESEAASEECLHDYKVTGMDLVVLSETKALVQTLVKDIAKLSKQWLIFKI